MSDLTNTSLGQYKLIEAIGHGGMSTVYKAYQESLDRFVAVKVLLANRDPQFAVRFKREARAVAALQHHNILPIYDYGEQNGLLYFVMQYVKGGTTLHDLLGKPLAPDRALLLAGHVLAALDYAHRHGVIHRDIKPANVLLPEPSWAVLADFGIAKLVNDSQHLTMTGLIIGTAAYMAPEQASGMPIDARTDLYSVGVMLYEMVTGRVPFDANTPMAVLSKHVYEPPPPPRSLNPRLHPLVEELLLRALAKNPDHRFQNAAEMRAELDRVAGQLNAPHSPPEIDELYELGVRAFQEGRWSDAVAQLSRVVVLAPNYEDATSFLKLARDAQAPPKSAPGTKPLDIAGQAAIGTTQTVRPRPGAAESSTLIERPPAANLCPACQRPIQPDWQVCPYCRAAILPAPASAAGALPQQAATGTTIEAAPALAGSPRRGRRLLWATLLLAALLLCGVGGMIWNSNRSAGSAEPTSLPAIAAAPPTATPTATAMATATLTPTATLAPTTAPSATAAATDTATPTPAPPTATDTAAPTTPPTRKPAAATPIPQAPAPPTPEPPTLAPAAPPTPEPPTPEPPTATKKPSRPKPTSPPPP